MIAFEEEVVRRFEDRQILAPIHLDNGNENQLIDVFRRHVRQDDWVLGSWRMHYKCLLKGVPPDELMAHIVAGKSISLCFPAYRILSSAIVGGVLPIAIGLALGIRRRGGAEKVVCFLGDMTAETGMFHECRKYARNHDLPVRWVIEDNNKSTCTDTRVTWGAGERLACEELAHHGDVVHFKYTSKYPHSGGGRRIQF